MTILAAGPTDSGAILHPDIVDTHVQDVGERTQNMAPYRDGLPPAYRRSGATGQQPVYGPQTIAIVDLQESTIPPPPAPLPSPPKPAARPWFYRGRRRVRELRPAWAYLAVGAGLGSVGTVLLELAGIAVLVVWR